MLEIYHQFIDGLKHITLPELVAVIAGIGSVYFSRLENILVYPVGLVSTLLYIYLSFQGDLFGEALVNGYYSVMSIYGWILWARKDRQHRPILHITYSSPRDWSLHLGLMAVLYILLFLGISYLKRAFAPGAIPWADAFASATALTGMWLMARKKVESWYYWIATNIASVPLYFVKGLVLTSVFYFILLFMAVWGLLEWRRRAHLQPA